MGFASALEDVGEDCPFCRRRHHFCDRLWSCLKVVGDTSMTIIEAIDIAMTIAGTTGIGIVAIGAATTIPIAARATVTAGVRISSSRL
jgi:hypothetical protein